METSPGSQCLMMRYRCWLSKTNSPPSLIPAVFTIPFEMSARDIARNAYLTCQDSWTNAKYFLRDRVRNAESRRMFLSDVPKLDEFQQRIVKDLVNRGIAFSHFDELFADSGRWDLLSGEMNGFLSSEEVKRAAAEYSEGSRVGEWNKDYLIRKYPDRAVLAADSPWLSLVLSSRILSVVNSYLELWSKLYYFDLWYTFPVTGTASASQNWHRDPEDRKLVKIFLYFSDVTAEAGPLQYVPGSRRSGGPYSHLWRKRHEAYPPAGEFEARIPSSQWVTGIGSPGTLMFVDTTGFHRGGYATKETRLSATWTFVTPASYTDRRIEICPTSKPLELSDPARFALAD